VSEGKRVRIVIIDDHKLVREGVRMILQTQPEFEVVGTASNGKEGLSAVVLNKPDIVLLDLDLGGESGLDLISEVQAASEHSRILILTGVRDLAMHQQCVRAGAKGLVHKEAAHEVLVKAVQKVNAGEIWFDRTMMSSILNEMLDRKKAKEADPEAAKISCLTVREKEVIGLICEGLKNKQIAERLFISDTTVRHHLTSIFSKLDVSDRLELVIYSFRFGISAPPK
jgi:DNA-binding NarL/FixJ family response regulator